MSDLRAAIEQFAAELEAAGMVTLYESPAELAVMLRDILAARIARTTGGDR